MKKAILGIMVLSLFAVTSCKKSSSSNPGGSWTFKTVTYNTVTCQGVGTDLIASNVTTGNTSTYGTVELYFSGTTLPTTGGTYTVTNGILPTGTNQVGIALTSGGATGSTYFSTGGNGTNQTVAVTVSNGKVSVSGSGIELLNSTTAGDSSALQLSITQLQ